MRPALLLLRVEAALCAINQQRAKTDRKFRRNFGAATPEIGYDGGPSLDPIQPTWNDSTTLNGNLTLASGPLWSYSKIVLDGRITAAQGKPLSPWTLHDLRRTTRTDPGQAGRSAAHRRI